MLVIFCMQLFEFVVLDANHDLAYLAPAGTSLGSWAWVASPMEHLQKSVRVCSWLRSMWGPGHCAKSSRKLASAGL